MMAKPLGPVGLLHFAQRLLVDLELLGDIGLGDAESRGVLNESALVSGRHIFGWHFPFRVTQPKDARERHVIVRNNRASRFVR
jgi:hypothetical protein